VRLAGLLLVVATAGVLGLRGDRLSRLLLRDHLLGELRSRRLRWPAGRAGVPAAAALAGSLASTAGPVAGVVAGTLTAVLVRRWQQGRRTAEAGRRGAAELELLSAFAAELRAGRQPGMALALVAPSGPAGSRLAEATAAAGLGGDVATALRHGAPDSATFSRLAVAWEVSTRAGAPLADLVNRVEAEVRAGQEQRLKAEVELAGARATGGLLAGLPILGVILGQLMGAAPLHVLLHTPAGALCCAGGLTLELAGLAWVGRLTAVASGRLP